MINKINDVCRRISAETYSKLLLNWEYYFQKKLQNLYLLY